MRIDRIGTIVPGFHVLGSPEVPSYLLEAPQAALFDAGYSCLGKVYARETRKILGPKAPSWLFLTHVHFDHCGAVAYLKQAFPGLRVAASQRAKEIMQRPGALALMEQLSQHVAQVVAPRLTDETDLPPFGPFEVEEVLTDGQEVDLGGGLTVRVLATPGHTRDFLSYFIPGPDILICSEGAGCGDPQGYVVSEFLVDYQAYLDSIHRLVELKAKVLCQGHGCVYTADSVPEFLKNSLACALDYKVWVERLLDEEHGDQERVVQRIKAQEYDPRPFPKQPEPAYLLNLGARVKHLAALRQAAANQS